MREIKFRAWDSQNNQMITDGLNMNLLFDKIRRPWLHWMEYTGLKDCHGKEIYELCELNRRYRVIYKSPKFCLQEIISGDIIDFNDKDTYEITAEYSPISENTKRSID